MGKIITSIRVRDTGEFHNTLAKLYIQKGSDGEETVFIRYGFYNQDFLPCTAIHNGDKIYLQKAMVGRLGDIKVPYTEWLKILSAMGSKVLLNQWKEKLKIAA